MRQLLRAWKDKQKTQQLNRLHWHCHNTKKTLVRNAWHRAAQMSADRQWGNADAAIRRSPGSRLRLLLQQVRPSTELHGTRLRLDNLLSGKCSMLSSAGPHQGSQHFMQPSLCVARCGSPECHRNPSTMLRGLWSQAAPTSEYGERTVGRGHNE